MSNNTADDVLHFLGGLLGAELFTKAYPIVEYYCDSLSMSCAIDLWLNDTSFSFPGWFRKHHSYESGTQPFAVPNMTYDEITGIINEMRNGARWDRTIFDAEQKRLFKLSKENSILSIPFSVRNHKYDKDVCPNYIVFANICEIWIKTLGSDKHKLKEFIGSLTVENFADEYNLYNMNGGIIHNINIYYAGDIIRSEMVFSRQDFFNDCITQFDTSSDDSIFASLVRMYRYSETEYPDWDVNNTASAIADIIFRQPHHSNNTPIHSRYDKKNGLKIFQFFEQFILPKMDKLKLNTFEVDPDPEGYNTTSHLREQLASIILTGIHKLGIAQLPETFNTINTFLEFTEWHAGIMNYLLIKNKGTLGKYTIHGSSLWNCDSFIDYIIRTKQTSRDRHFFVEFLTEFIESNVNYDNSNEFIILIARINKITENDGRMPRFNDLVFELIKKYESYNLTFESSEDLNFDDYYRVLGHRCARNNNLNSMIMSINKITNQADRDNELYNICNSHLNNSELCDIAKNRIIDGKLRDKVNKKINKQRKRHNVTVNGQK